MRVYVRVSLKVAMHEGEWLGDENTPLHLLTP